MIDTSLDKSIYIQIAEKIENDILIGILDEEERAPSTNEFANIYFINPATARKGLNLLVDKGILYKKRGMGMYVKKGAKEMLLIEKQELFFKYVLPNVLDEANKININIESIIDFFKNRRNNDRNK